MKFPRILFALSLLGLSLALLGAGVLLAQRTRWYQSLSLPRMALPQVAPLRMSRPEGMAPVAWQAYLRACQSAKIHPLRVGQTIGDHPRSVGYHKRDGVLTVEGEKIEYSAAVDLGTTDLTPAQIERFVDALAAQGFAAFYRHKGKWKGVEHIHAIYAFLPMKPQLQLQVGEFLRERRKTGRRPKWEKKLRRQREKLKHWML